MDSASPLALDSLPESQELSDTTMRLFRRDEAPDAAVPHLSEFAEAIDNPRFPCFFASSAFRRNELLFGIADVSAGLEPVVLLFDESASAIGSNIDQTIVLWLAGSETNALEEDYAFTSAVLRELLRTDSVTWPNNRPVDPRDPRWDFWYRGIDFFINVSTPNHVKRRSRNLGSVYTLVIQSRTSFDRVGVSGDGTREKIRARIETFDDVPTSPALGNHGDTPEIEQYFLGDSNEATHSAPLLSESDIVTALRERKERE